MAFSSTSKYGQVVRLENLTGPGQAPAAGTGQIFGTGSLVAVSAPLSSSGDLKGESLTLVNASVSAAGGASLTSANLNDGGITNAGSIAGATTIDGSGDLTMGTITMTGFAVDADGDTALKSLKVDDGSTIGPDSVPSLLTLTADGDITVSDGAYDFDIAAHDGTNGLKLGGTLVTATAAELNYTDVTSAGVAEASKALVLDTNKNIGTINRLTASHAKIGTLDVDTINSRTVTESILEVADKTIIAGLSGSASDIDGGGLRFGGSGHEAGLAEILFKNDSDDELEFKLGGTLRAKVTAAGAISGSGALQGESLALVNASVNAAGVASLTSANLNAGGITNAGAIAGATTVSGSGKLSAGGGIDSGLNAEFTVSNAGAVVAASLNNSNGGITQAGAISGATTIVASGKITGNEFATDGNEFTVSTAGAVVAASITGSGNADFGGTLKAGFGQFSVDAQGDATAASVTSSAGGLFKGARQFDQNVRVYGNSVAGSEGLTNYIAALNEVGGVGFLNLNSSAGYKSQLSFMDGATTDAKVSHDASQLIISSSTDVQFQNSGGIVGFEGHVHASASLHVAGATTAAGITASGILDVTNTSNASGYDGESGALRTDGGASIAKDVYVGAALNVNGVTSLNGDVNIGDAAGDAIAIRGAVTVLDTASPFTVNSNVIKLGDDASDSIFITGTLLMDGDLTLPDDHVVKASSFDTYSDITLKKDIKPMDNALDKVMKLEPVTYEMKNAPGKADLGFIAQDVAKVVPEVCGLDANGIGRSIDYGRMSAVIAGAVKAQQAQIEELKAVIAKLQK